MLLCLRISLILWQLIYKSILGELILLHHFLFWHKVCSISDLGWCILWQVISFLTLVAIFFFFFISANVQFIISKFYVITSTTMVLIAITLILSFTSVLDMARIR